MKYIFRGVVVFDYDEKTKAVEVPNERIANNFNFCKFIPEDYKLMSKFFDMIHKHSVGEDIELRDIKVN